MNRPVGYGWTRTNVPIAGVTFARQGLLGYAPPTLQPSQRPHNPKFEGMAFFFARDEGRWKLESTFNGPFQVNIEREGEPSELTTSNALKALKGMYS